MAAYADNDVVVTALIQHGADASVEEKYAQTKVVRILESRIEQKELTNRNDYEYYGYISSLIGIKQSSASFLFARHEDCFSFGRIRDIKNL